MMLIITQSDEGVSAQIEPMRYDVIMCDMESITINARPVELEIKEGMIQITLADERIIAAPLAWYA